MSTAAVPVEAQENPFQLNTSVDSVPSSQEETKTSVSIPDALAALSEPVTKPEPEPEPQLKFANVTAGETLDIEEPLSGDKTSEPEAGLEENVTKWDEMTEGVTEDVPEHVTADITEQVATCAPVLAALPEKKQAEPQVALRADELRQIVRTEPAAKEVSAPKAAVDAAAEIGLSSCAPKTVKKEEEPPVRQEVALFTGPNSDIYVKAWEGLKTGSILRSGCWSIAGFVFSIAWFAYRRLYSIAMVWLIVLAAVAVYAPNLTAAVFASAMICGGFWGKILYARHADQMIRAKIRSANEPDEYIASLVRAGGVSLPMGIFVGVLTCGLIALPGLQ